MTTIDQEAILGTPLVLPPIEEQAAIAAFLDRETGKIDTLIAEQEKLLTLLAEKRQATISHAVTRGLNPGAPMKDSGVTWLGQVPAHWAVDSARRHLVKSLSNGIFKKKDEFGQGTLLVNVFDVYRQDFRIDYTSLERVMCSSGEQAAYKVMPDDILFVRSSLKQEGIAAVAIAGHMPENVVYECHLIQARFVPTSVIGRFASYVFNSAVYRAHMVRSAKVTTMTTIDQEAILGTPLVLPPIEEQAAIAAFLDTETSRVEDLKKEAARAIDLLKERRSALIAAAVTGKIDVRHVAALRELAA
jgi:type I restriction enzyme S subunit